MKFKDFKYERVDVDKIVSIGRQFIEVLKNKEESLENQIKAVNEFYGIMDTVDTSFTLANIRNSIDTADAFYNTEREFLDKSFPYIQELHNEFSKAILESSEREGLENKFGKLLFQQGDLAIRTFKPEIIDLLQEENKLSSSYDKLIASAQIELNGQAYTLSQMQPFTNSLDRETRKKASLAVSKFYADNEEEFDEIYDKLVHVRNEIAIILGYENFIELGYHRMGRLDYSAKEVGIFRKSIQESIVPLANELQQRKIKELGIKNPRSYDYNIAFATGNPTPKGDEKWLVDKALKMYKEMSKETGEFFQMMIDMELMDLGSKKNKQAGGYCTAIPTYKVPFIFANFNGTSHDVDVLTHEAGHAFQGYCCRNLFAPYRWGTFEVSEIHSMSMEFLAWPWAHEFFLEDSKKYLYFHLTQAIEFLPYAITVDEFQHEVYKNPHLTPKERKNLWRDLEKKNLPHKIYDEDDFLNRGGFWFRQGHIFQSPFYYIDYALAQLCALQFWNVDNKEEIWKKYLKLCNLGGSKSFLDILETSGLDNPFEKKTIEKIAKRVELFLKNV